MRKPEYSKLDLFLFVLVRDHVKAGVIEQAIKEHVEKAVVAGDDGSYKHSYGCPCIKCLPGLMAYARSLGQRLA